MTQGDDGNHDDTDFTDDEPEPTAEQREAEARARDERISERIERRQQGRRGVRRFRPGLARGVPWQFAAPSQRAQEEALDREIFIIAAAVRDVGPVALDELRRVVGAKYWGPGRFRPAVREAIAEQQIVRAGRNRVGPPPQG